MCSGGKIEMLKSDGGCLRQGGDDRVLGGVGGGVLG